ncbi:MAG: hypothetical protein ACHP7D_10785, partial [Lysobacterales bacterium]
MHFRWLRRHRLLQVALAIAASLSIPLFAADRATEREQFRAALAAASRPPEGAWKKLAAGLDPHYPLYPYIELAVLRGRIAKLERGEV